MVRKTGRCLCGAVAFEAMFSDTRYGACHCGMCRRWTGGPFFARKADRLTITQGAGALLVYRSSEWAARVSCGTCGASLWYQMGEGEDATRIVAVGALDDQSDMVLASEIFIDCKPAGYALAGDLKRMTEAEVIAAFAPSSGA